MVQIRPAKDQDMAAITDIYSAAVREGTASFETVPPDLAVMIARRDALLAADFPYLVAEYARDIVGYCYAGAYRSRPAYRFTVEDSIYISSRVHGLGIGRALLARLVAECEARGFRQMIAVIGDSNNHASINLHKALGFAHAGVIRDVGYKSGRWLDQVMMQRSLGDGAQSRPE